MSREIKFRVFFYDGKDKSTGEMLTAEESFNDGYIDFNHWWLKPTDKCSIIMQFTGLKDKNGKEIYEGDLVNNQEDIKWIREVKYVHYGFWFIQINGDAKYPITFEGLSEKREDYKSNWEVIGTIHENPELLK